MDGINIWSRNKIHLTYARFLLLVQIVRTPILLTWVVCKIFKNAIRTSFNIILSFVHINNSHTICQDLWTILNWVHSVERQAWNFIVEWTVEGIHENTFAELNIRIKIFPLYGSHVSRASVSWVNNDSIPLNPWSLRGAVHGHGKCLTRHCQMLREAVPFCRPVIPSNGKERRPSPAESYESHCRRVGGHPD